MKRTLLIGLLVAVSAAANAVIVEHESNNTIATANAITPGLSLPYADTGDIPLTSHDVDFFSLYLPSNVALAVATTPLQNHLTSPDTVLGLFDASGNILALNDDSGPGTGSFIQYEVTTPGTYFIGITGTGDDLWTGNHSQTGSYQLTVSVSPEAVPEPASMAALGLGALAIVRRRKGAK